MHTMLCKDVLMRFVLIHCVIMKKENMFACPKMMCVEQGLLNAHPSMDSIEDLEVECQMLSCYQSVLQLHERLVTICLG